MFWAISVLLGFSLKTIPRYWHLCYDFVLRISVTSSPPLIVLVIPEVSRSHNVQSAQELRALAVSRTYECGERRKGGRELDVIL